VITRGFYVGEHKVTVAQLCQFLNTAGSDTSFVPTRVSLIEQRDELFRPKAGFGEFPALDVPFEVAVHYCDCLSRLSGRVFRLPTEAEWEYAARGEDGRRYPWGDEVVAGKKYVPSRGWMYAEVGEVGTYAENRTPSGIYEMVGIGGEWCADWYQRIYESRTAVDPKGPKRGTGHVLRGRHGTATAREGGGDQARGDAWMYSFRVVMESDLAEVRSSGP
jgi:formylglycine-generating enzyme required for sulfatase activity